LYQEYLTFEKQFGEKEEIDEIILNKRRIFYRELIAQNSYNYDAWFDLVNLELTTKDFARIRETFEAAVKQVPPGQEKRFWRRYIYLWYNFAIFEELDAADYVKAAAVYDRAIALVPHQLFTFSKLWVFYAQFLLRT
jgi:crooked neck